MKKLFFIAVILGTTVFGGIFGYSYIRLKTKTPQAYSETGKKYYDQGKYSDAIIQFINALKRNGNDRDSRYYLALSYLNLPDLRAGVNHLRKLLEIFPDDAEANLKLGNIYLQQGGPSDPAYYHEAQKLAQRVLDRDPQNVNVQALILKGNSLAGLKDLENVKLALEALTQATSLEPKNVSAWISLGRLHMQRKDLKEAEKAFLNARSSDETSASAVVSLANFYRLAGNSEKAEQIFKDALARFPANREISNQMSDFYFRSRRFDEAEKVLRTAAAAGAAEKDPLPTLDLAEFFSLQNRPEDARKVLLEAKSKFPESTELAIKIAENLLVDEPEQAKQEIDRVLKAEPYNPAGYVLLGGFQYNVGQFDDAAETLGKEPAISSPSPQVHYLLGKISMRKGKADEAQTHFEQSARMNDRYLAPKIALAELFIAKGQYSNARQQVQQTLKIDSRNMSARLMNATLDSINKNYVAAEKEYSALVREFPNNAADIHRQIALSEMTRGRTNEAEKSFLRALELAPQSEQLFAELISFYAQTNQTERAMQKLNTIQDSQKTAFHYELTGMTAEQAGKVADAESAYRKALEKDSQRINVHTRLFNLYLRTGRPEEAERTLDVLAEKSPAKNVVYAMKGSLQSSRGDSTGAEQSYRKALDLDPQTDIAANNLAYMLADEGRDLTTALQMAQDVKRRHPEDPAIADTLGWIYFKLDLIPQAKTQAEFAVSKRPGNGEAQYHLGEIYRKNSEFAKAEAAFKKAVNSPASSPQQLKQKDLAATALKEVQKILATKK